jgi:hypothetical protein
MLPTRRRVFAPPFAQFDVGGDEEQTDNICSWDLVRTPGKGVSKTSRFQDLCPVRIGTSCFQILSGQQKRHFSVPSFVRIEETASLKVKISRACREKLHVELGLKITTGITKSYSWKQTWLYHASMTTLLTVCHPQAMFFEYDAIVVNPQRTKYRDTCILDNSASFLKILVSFRWMAARQ